jgi:hypothetical protein
VRGEGKRLPAEQRGGKAGDTARSPREAAERGRDGPAPAQRERRPLVAGDAKAALDHRG